MSSPLSGLKPAHLWRHFEKILAIPHCSGNERAFGDYIISVAEGLGLPWKRDRVGNVLVSKPGTPGRETGSGVILQGHMDMVCEKNSEVVHDFSKDPIRTELAGDWVRASGTTLGADNGIGCAAALAVMEEGSLVHGPLEFLFTVDEETGLTGANRIQKGFLKGKKLLNLDSEDEGTFTIGCAGGADSELIFPVVRKKSKSGELYRLKVHGLRGGHSGLDINQGRGNAIKLLARMLREAADAARFDLVGLEGGNKRNAIPREAWAILACPDAAVRSLKKSFKTTFDKIRVEYQAVEGEAAFSFEKAEGLKDFAMTSECRTSLLNFILALPHGVVAMHPEIPNLVETSTNLAIVRTEGTRVEVICSTRSSVASALEATRGVLRSVTELAGAKIDLKDGYPGWMPDLQSSLLKVLREVYKKGFGKDAEVVAVHAGLECGIIGEKFPGMEMISFGPTMRNPHSPEERVHVGSVEAFWKFLVSALAELA
jgi:dipeptidase D